MSRDTSPYIVRMGGEASVTHTGKMVPGDNGELIEQVIVTLAGGGFEAPRLLRPMPATATIYFAGPEGGPIKIGFAARVNTRLRDLRLANAYPLRLWASVQAAPSLEREYHRQFAAHRLHGEWFTRCPEIEAEIERLNANPSLTSILNDGERA